MTTAQTGDDGVVPFVRRYTRSWLHAVTTAALTAFGALAILHRGFVAVAVGAYVLPPVFLYLTGREPGTGRRAETATTETAETVESPSEGTDGTEEGPRKTGAEPGSGPHWSAVDVPTDAALLDVTVADGRAVAVGADGVVLAGDGDGWRLALEAGPGADSETLRGADATDDGEAVWVAGDGGAVGRLDAGTGRHVDYSAPDGLTDNWSTVAVGGAADDEVVLLGNGSGEVLRGRYRDGEVAWEAPEKPGGGSSLSGLVLADASVGYACDTNDGVFETRDGGERFSRIGVESAAGTLTDVATAEGDDCVVADDDGVIHRRDGGTWTPVRLGDGGLEAVAVRSDDGVACGGDVVYERDIDGREWERSVVPGTGRLSGVAVGPTRAVAVGDDGTVVERS